MSLPIFLKQFHIKKFKKGERIYTQYEIPEHAYMVESGIVRAYNITSNGEEKTIAFKLRYNIFSIGWLFSKYRQTLYFYEAYTDCELRCISKPAFHAALQANAEFSHLLLNFLLNEHISTGLRLNALEQSQSREKILYMLQSLCLEYGKSISKHEVRIDIPLRQQDLANILGITRETTALELRKLNLEGIVAYRRCVYTVRTDKLSVMMGEDYDPGIFLQLPLP